MKNLLFFLFAITLISCKSDDDSKAENLSTTNYFPLTAASTWNYTNENELGTTDDTMFEMGTQQSNGKTYTNLDATQPSNGLMVTVLADNLVRKANGQFIINGALGMPVEGFPDITIPLNDVVLFDANALANAQLSTLSGTLNEDIMLDNGQTLPLTLNYTSTTVQDDILNTYTVENQIFNDVVTSSIILNLEIITTIDIAGTIINIPILAPQNVLVVKNYYAANTGLVFSEVTVDYMLSDLSGLGFDLPIPSESSQVTTSAITSFTIN